MSKIFDASKIRKDFPIISQSETVYLDSAATSQKPQVVIDTIDHYYRENNANVHRGVYRLSESATAAFERTRTIVAKFLGNVSVQEVIFTKGTTDSINLVAQTWGLEHIKAGDEIVLSIAEHHSNIVPWQILAKRVGAEIKFIPLTENFRLDLDAAKTLINEKTKLVSIAHVSNVLGVIHPVKEIAKLAKNVGAIFMVDGAQGAPHLEVDVRDIGCDFYAFSGHKVCGPTGVGVLYGRKELLQSMPPYQGGGDMINRVTVTGSTWAELPYKFEAGTPNIAGVVGLGAAIEYLASYDHQLALAHEVRLGRMLYDALNAEKNFQVYYDGGENWVGVVTFSHKFVHPHDMAAICDSHNVCLRAGHHCAQPLMNYLNTPATSRLSPYIYNNESDIEKAITAVLKAENLLA